MDQLLGNEDFFSLIDPCIPDDWRGFKVTRQFQYLFKFYNFLITTFSSSKKIT